MRVNEKVVSVLVLASVIVVCAVCSTAKKGFHDNNGVADYVHDSVLPWADYWIHINTGGRAKEPRRRIE